MEAYKELSEDEISNELFIHFNRKQVVTKCLRKVEDKWVIKDICFTEQWGDAEYTVLVKCLKNTVHTHGTVFAAFTDDKLKGFASVERNLFGNNSEYCELSSLHVSEDMRGKGIGKKLFNMAAIRAKEYGAKKLYISAHSSVETQAFYKALGCIEAKEYSIKHVEREPFDCQLEIDIYSIV